MYGVQCITTETEQNPPLFAAALDQSIPTPNQTKPNQGANKASELAKKISIAAILVGLVVEIVVWVTRRNEINNADDDGF